jgi:hypothetical protein
MNSRLIVGVVAIVLGLIVLVWPAFLSVIVGLCLILFGLWFTWQGAGQGNTL